MLIWLASYPRSGNTFLRILFYRAFGIKTLSIYDKVADDPGDASTKAPGSQVLPKGWTQEAARADDDLWLVKTHEFPPPGDKAIYIVRDGRESLASYLHYLGDRGKDADLWSVIAGNIWPGGWADHVRAWDPLKPGRLLLKFEELTANPASAIETIGRWIGRESISQNVPTFAQLNALDPKFFRSGRNDSWRSEFTHGHHILFWLLSRDVMLEHGYRENIPAPFEQEPTAVLRDLAAAIRDRIKELSAGEKGNGETVEDIVKQEFAGHFGDLAGGAGE